MAKKKQNIPAYGTAEINGVTYFRTRITDADGKRVPIYASTCEELYKKEQDARQQVQDILFRKQNPTVEDYCERWLLMRSATVTQDTLRNYRREMYKYIVEPLGNLYTLSPQTAIVQGRHRQVYESGNCPPGYSPTDSCYRPKYHCRVLEPFPT